jgi:hypothetical protein
MNERQTVIGSKTTFALLYVARTAPAANLARSARQQYAQHTPQRLSGAPQ